MMSPATIVAPSSIAAPVTRFYQTRHQLTGLVRES
jgi:hypothetical protein